MSLEDKLKNAKETSWPLVTPKKETLTYLDGFADGLNMANNSTNKMLDKIRAEIEDMDAPAYGFEGFYKCQSEVLQILDKYKAESEVDNGND